MKRDDKPILLPWDGHTHTEFCDHGTHEKTRLMIERAIRLGFTRYSLTEHPPFPPSFPDPGIEKDGAIQPENLEPYLKTAAGLREEFRERIQVDVGMEVDYVHHLPQAKKEIFDRYEEIFPRLDWEGTILSVHTLDGLSVDESPALDHSPEYLRETLLARYATTHSSGKETDCVDELQVHYCEILEEAMSQDWKPGVLIGSGISTLPRKFRKVFSCRDEERVKKRFIKVLDCVKDFGYALDANCAGEFKKYCGERYVPDWILPEVLRRGIPLVYGSDAHGVADIGRGFKELETAIQKASLAVKR